jgi:Protein of unknown function (DUF3617)
MYRTELCSLLGVSVLALAAIGATAQTAPKIKPGLWQIHIEQERNGQKLPNASERMKDHMKDMTPERRKQFEEMMKQRGVDPNATDTIKVCYSQKMVDHGAWTDQGGCKTDFTDRSATSWKWHSVCSALGYEGDGEATFSDADNFTVKSSGVATAGGKTVKSNSTRTGKWLSADCGGVKPMDDTPMDGQ